MLSTKSVCLSVPLQFIKMCPSLHHRPSFQIALTSECIVVVPKCLTMCLPKCPWLCQWFCEVPAVVHRKYIFQFAQLFLRWREPNSTVKLDGVAMAGLPPSGSPTGEPWPDCLPLDPPLDNNNCIDSEATVHNPRLLIATKIVGVL